jgi:hypothetical protein
MAKKRDRRVGIKIKHLISEGESKDQAVATAINMERHHRLTKRGGYRRVRKGRRA